MSYFGSTKAWTQYKGTSQYKNISCTDKKSWYKSKKKLTEHMFTFCDNMPRSCHTLGVN